MLKYLFALGLFSTCAAAQLPLHPDSSGFPAGWCRYGRGPGIIRFENGLLRMADQNDIDEWGIYKVFENPAPGKYEITVDIKGDLTRSQMVVIPDGQRLVSVNMTGSTGGDFKKFGIGYEVLPGCKKVTFYIFGFYRETPDFLIRSMDLSQVKEFSPAVQLALRQASPLPPKPITKLKKLYLTTPLDQAVIVPGDTPALQKAAAGLARKFGGRIVPADSVKLPLTQHIIALGNRTNNVFINKLYIRSFCYTDLVYPGKGGHELRSIHNPTGRGFNVILCGGSDDAGAVKAANLLAEKEKNVGFLQNVHFPAFRKDFDACDPDHYYLNRAGGYFGWNLIAGMMALFYQTGDTFYAGEFLRLAFPDAKARKDIQRYNPESFDKLHDPLSGPYHYLGHQMILLWDLIEEHPVFNDEQRLAVTDAFRRQWQHHIRDTRAVGRHMIATSRHGQWGQICNYSLARYFDRDYPDPAWTESLHRAEAEFSLANYKQGWIQGEGGLLSWLVSGAINPSLQFFALSGGAAFDKDGALANVLRFWETQWDGTPRSEVLTSASRQTFYLAAEHTGDGKYLWYADLLKPYPADKFKLGASFSPTGKIQSRTPAELIHNWTAAPMKLGEHRFYGLKAPLNNCYLGVGWRDSLDTTGDWISFNCFNEKYRTPFKLLSLYGLRLNGHRLLSGFGNYVQPVRGGITDKTIPTVGQVYSFGKAGNSVFFSGGVPDHAYSAWQRDLILRPRTWLILADTITPAEKSEQEISAMIHLQTSGSIMQAPGTENQIIFTSTHTDKAIPVKEMQARGIPECAITSGPRMVVFRTQKVGDRARISFRVAQDMTCLPVLTLFDHNTRAGAVNVYLDGQLIQRNVPHFSADSQLTSRSIKFGKVELKKGEHAIDLEVAAISNQASSNWISAGALALPPATDTKQLMTMTTSAGTVTLRAWNEAVVKRNMASDPAKPVTTFSLFAGSTPVDPVKGCTLSNDAALFLMPEPVLAFCRTYPELGQATLAVLEGKRISGHGIRSLTGSFNANAPVSLDWKFGEILTVSGKAGTECTVNGKLYRLDQNGLLELNHITPASRQTWSQLLLAAKKDFAPAAQSVSRIPADAKLTEMTKLPGGLSFIRPVKDGFIAGAGKRLLIMDAQYHILREIPFAATVISGVEAGDLYIAGTLGEEIAAISKQGEKRWSFTSKIAPDVEASHKYYWFKSASPGVMSLEYRDGRIYAGSACTMEILDLQGKLLARHGQTWGACRWITLINRPDGSYDAVGLRNNGADGMYMWSVNSKTGQNRRSYADNMPGYVHFPSFGSLYRTKAFAADFDGDGEEELLADAQGMYSWLNLYNTADKPEAQANLGPGNVIRNWTVGDFNADKRPEAVVATWSRQLVALTGNCKPLWTADIPVQGEHIAINPAKREIAIAGKNQIYCVDQNGREKYYITLPFEITHLWSSKGAFYAASAGLICRIDHP